MGECSGHVGSPTRDPIRIGFSPHRRSRRTFLLAPHISADLLENLRGKSPHGYAKLNAGYSTHMCLASCHFHVTYARGILGVAV